MSSTPKQPSVTAAAAKNKKHARRTKGYISPNRLNLAAKVSKLNAVSETSLSGNALNAVNQLASRMLHTTIMDARDLAWIKKSKGIVSAAHVLAAVKTRMPESWLEDFDNYRAQVKLIRQALPYEQD